MTLGWSGWRVGSRMALGRSGWRVGSQKAGRRVGSCTALGRCGYNWRWWIHGWRGKHWEVPSTNCRNTRHIYTPLRDPQEWQCLIHDQHHSSGKVTNYINTCTCTHTHTCMSVASMQAHNDIKLCTENISSRHITFAATDLPLGTSCRT